MTFNDFSLRSKQWICSRLTEDKMPITLLVGAISIVLIAIFGAVIIFILYLVNFKGYFSKSQDIWGQFGDYFGGTLNPFFSLLSLLALLVTLALQSRELSSSTKALEEQSSLMKLQNFESMFLTMISMCNDNIKSIDLGDDEAGQYTGKRALRRLYERLIKTYETQSNVKHDMTGEEYISYIYKIFYNNNEHHIGELIRLLEQIIILIDTRAADDNTLYWTTLRSQLSSSELMLLLYHSIAFSDIYTSRNLLVDKKLFESIDRNKLLDPIDHEHYLNMR